MCEDGLEASGADDGVGQRRFVDEEHVIDQCAHGRREHRVDQGAGGGEYSPRQATLMGRDPELPRGAGQQVRHVGLVLEHHERGDVAVRREVAGSVESVFDTVQVEVGLVDS